MSTARNLIKNRVKAGNTVIGVGCYSAALTATHEDKVIKVGNTTNDPWLDFYEEVIKHNSNNIHLPKVYNIHIDYDNDYYVAVVEKLYEHDDRFMGDIEGTDQLEDTVYECINDRSVSQFDFFVALDDCRTCYGEFDEYQLYAACNQIQDLIRRSWSDWGYCECGAEDHDSCDCGSERLSLDLHCNNFLYRKDGTIVINDPICDTDMEDVDDLANWADEQELTYQGTGLQTVGRQKHSSLCASKNGGKNDYYNYT